MQYFVIKAKIISNAPKFQILGFESGELKIKAKSLPAKNKANLEIIKELKKFFGAEIKIVKGLKSARKEIWIGLSEQHAKQKLSEL